MPLNMLVSMTLSYFSGIIKTITSLYDLYIMLCNYICKHKKELYLSLMFWNRKCAEMCDAYVLDYKELKCVCC